MLNGVGTNISMAYTSKYNNKSTGDKMDIEFEIGWNDISGTIIQAQIKEPICLGIHD